MRTDHPGFHVFPAKEAIRRVLHSPGVGAIMVISVVVVALNGVVPSVGRILEARTEVLAAGEYWRLATYVFPHDGGLVHVLLNMGLLALYGWQLERIVGTARFLVVYVAAGAVAMALLFSFRPIDAATGLTGGASLAVFAVVAATGVSYAAAGWSTHRRDVVRAAATVVVLLVLAGVVSMARRQLMDGSESVVARGVGGVTFGVVNHSLGIISGLLVGTSLLRGRSTRTSRSIVALVLTVTITIAALAIGTVRSSPNSRLRPTARPLSQDGRVLKVEPIDSRGG